MKHETVSERASDRELVVKRTFDGPARLVFRAWTNPQLFARWWVPKSFGLTLLSCEMDVRVGGGYRLVFAAGGGEMAFFGTYLEVVPEARLVWSNDEGGEGGAITTVTFTEKDGQTHLVMRDLFRSKEAADEACANGSTSGVGETFDQLDALLSTEAASALSA